MASHTEVARDGTPPPAYESRPTSLHEHRGPPPAFTDDRPRSPPHLSTDIDPASATDDRNPCETSETPPPAEASTGKRPSFIKNATQLYKDKRRAKEAARKVDYYKKLYGFVPKNAMTEAEWRDARERIPKTKIPFKARPGNASLLGLGGAAGVS